MSQQPKQRSGAQRAGLALVALLAAYLAFHGFGFLVFLSPGFLAAGIRGLDPPRKLLFTTTWGMIFAGAYHSWTFLDDWIYWLVLVVVRGIPWFVFSLPQIVLEKAERKTPILVALSTALGLTLVSWALLVTPAGFDWETPMAALSSWPWCLACLPWIGLLGGAFLVGFSSQLLLLGERRSLLLGLFVLVLWATVSLGLFRITQQSFPRDLKIALLQTGWSQSNKWDAKYRTTSKRRLFHMTKEAKEMGADLVIWPETAWPVYGLRGSESDSRAVGRLASELGVDILATSVEVAPGGVYNSVSLVTPESGFEEEYRKRRLLPFSEYLPLPYPLDSLYVGVKPHMGDRQFLQGDQAVVFNHGNYSFTPLICFESMVPYTLNQELAEGIDFIVVVTNDAGLHREFPKEAHFRSAILRAAQYRRPLVQAGNTGVTAVIDSRGVVLKRTERSLHGSKILITDWHQ